MQVKLERSSSGNIVMYIERSRGQEGNLHQQSGDGFSKNRTRIMAPIIIVDLQAWEAANLAGLAFLSVVILFILSITLLALCTSCQRQSFTLDNSGTVERSTSTLVRVVNQGNAAENPAPERNPTVLPEDLQLGPNQQFKHWRSHTLERNPQTTENGGKATL
ncbi:hypothetical protein PHYPO_G00020220 [Pangasianodon hypophthalmus]|uniref:Uncharacterized protein n=1 Tax=Pangasianodon hypophthalmus TaxID=310915 RepID=A0A5N5N7N4_PANHP|nr:hypothetical protein PHYPO_G00020220 [Pangasianodon hypophthalmus]